MLRALARLSILALACTGGFTASVLIVLMISEKWTVFGK